MSFLIDTCVLSELVKTAPAGSVIEWINAQPERRLFLSALTLAEIRDGVERLAPSRRRSALEVWLHDELPEQFEGRILPVDANVALTWGRISGRARRQGRTVPVVDGLIAATAVANDLILVSRNDGDFDGTGAEIFNPWISTGEFP